MTVTIPAAINDHTTDPDTDSRSLIGSPSQTSVKQNGNLPIANGAAQWTNEEAEGTAVGVLWPFPSSYDVSTDTKLLVWSWQFNAPNRIQCETQANGGVGVRIASGAGSAIYQDYYVAGNDTPAASAQAGVIPIVIDLNAGSPDATNGIGYSNSDIQAYGLYGTQEDIAGGNSMWMFVQGAHIFDTVKDGTNIVKFTGTSDFDDIIEAVLGSDYTDKIGGWVQKLSSTYFIPVAFQIGDTSTATVFVDNGVSVVSPSNNQSGDPRYRLTTQATRVYVSLRDNVADSCTFTGSYNWGVASPWDLDVDNDSSIDIDGASFVGMGNFTVGGSVTIDDATFRLASGSSVFDTGATFNSGTFRSDISTNAGTKTFSNVVMTSGTTLVVTAVATITLDDCVVQEIENTSGSEITVILTNGTPVPTATETSGSIVLQQVVTVSDPNLIDGTRVQLYNVTKDAELDNDTVSGGSGYSYSANIASSAVESGDTLRIRATYQSGTTAKLPIQSTGVISSTGLTFSSSQVDNDIYNENALDGSSASEFSWDSGNVQIDINDTDNATTIQRLAAWYFYYITTSTGVDEAFGGIQWDTLNTVQINSSIVDIELDNTKASPLLLTGGRLFRTDGATIISSSSNSIQIDYSPVYVAPSSTAPSAATVAAAVRTELSTELGRIDADVSLAVDHARAANSQTQSS